jgi:acyl carrier protein phosphodiesterase
MNWLAHLLLSEPVVEAWIGSVAADWVKGERRLAFSAGIQRGFALHRVVDHFTDTHPVVERSVARIQSPYKRYAGVLIDVFYDHFLARNWGQYSDMPMRTFVDTVYAAFDAHAPHLPEQVNRGFFYMRRDDWLGSYVSTDGVALTLRRISGRLRPGNLLAEGAEQIAAHYDALNADFLEFFPQLRERVRDWERGATV